MPGSQPTFECKRGKRSKRGKRGKGWYWNRLVKILQRSLVWVQLPGPHPIWRERQQDREIRLKSPPVWWNSIQNVDQAAYAPDTLEVPTYEAGNGVVSCCVQPSKDVNFCSAGRYGHKALEAQWRSAYSQTNAPWSPLVCLLTLLIPRWYYSEGSVRRELSFDWPFACTVEQQNSLTLQKSICGQNTHQISLLISVASVAMIYTSWNTEVSNDSPYQAHKKTGSCWNS